MQGQPPSTQQMHADAGDGVVRTVTQARGGVRRGTIKVLAVSTLLAVAGIGGVYLYDFQSAPTPQPNVVRSQTWNQAHLGARGLVKCGAFRNVFDRTVVIQREDRGSMAAAERMALVAQLSAAKAMPPVSLTPVQCGIPLG